MPDVEDLHWMEEEIGVNKMEFDKFLIDNRVNRERLTNDDNRFDRLKISKHKVSRDEWEDELEIIGNIPII